MKKILCTLGFSALLAGCVSGPTIYQNGIRDHRVEDNLYEVSFKGNDQTSAERVNLLWVYRCAEIAKEHGKAYVSLNDAEGKELVKPYAPKPRLPGFGAPTDWTEKTIPRADGVFRPSDQATLTPIGHTTVIHSTAVSGTRSFVHDGLARLFDDPLPIEAGVTFKVQTLLDELSGYVHGDPKASPPSLEAILAPARVVTPLGSAYAQAQLRLRALATQPAAGAGTNLGVALLHANIALSGVGSWVAVDTGYVADGSVVKSDGKSVTFIAALTTSNMRHRFERLHVDCGRGIGGVVVSVDDDGQSSASAAQLAALADVDTTMSRLDASNRTLADEACSAAGYQLAA